MKDYVTKMVLFKGNVLILPIAEKNNTMDFLVKNKNLKSIRR